ncbi:His Kinase A (phospho-acceptor) domain-containing protein [Desulfocicer vacuolatum DSM 3385]|uniref:histidine kinase n=1 Tax=Desulfocicer vacuolatum DSM 3385 TaxID=1121400 RepID=A0A1W2AG15_9BACT|nr:response regulator [Desulfocicer vacuolatum]SMC59401.1 His Kinase A (phospho-acceptor) domain-containing protein [Desulfocicer vacuolatum DSM 3385]
MKAIFSYLKDKLFSHKSITLAQWQEKSFVFVLMCICVVSLFPLINSCIRAAGDGLWVNLTLYVLSYLLCFFITVAWYLPFKLRAWMGVMVLFGLGCLAMFSIGPLGSGRIWMFFASVFATLVLGINSGIFVLTLQLIVLLCFTHLLKINFSFWANLQTYSRDIWVTTSITFMFLSIISVVSMGRLIRGLSRSLERSRKTGEELKKTARQLNRQIQAHRGTIATLKEMEKERIKYETRIQQMQKMEAIGSLAGGIAHDFNNILSPMIGYSEMIKEELVDKPELQSNLDEVLKASVRAKNLVAQILSFSRQESEIRQPVAVQKVARECLNLLRSTIPRTIHIESIIDTQCDKVFGDPTKLHQVMMNLGINAYHAMELTGGTLWVIFEESLVEEGFCPTPDLPPGRYGLLVFRDTGEGMDKQILEKIFDPHFTTKSRGKGSGLGLSVVKSIIEEFKGNIRVQSQKGVGTEFCIYFPLMSGEQQIQFVPEEIPIPRGNEHILLVDDEKSVACMAHQMLERLGYHVTMTTAGDDALQIFSRTPSDFDLLITDMTMPQMTGVELLSRARAIRQSLPVILCSGFSDQVNTEKARKLKFNAYLDKPFSLRKIGETIREVLDE